MFHETIWFLRGDTNIKYLKTITHLYGDLMLFQGNLPGMQKEEFSLKVLQVILLIGTKQWKNMVRE